MPKDIEKIDPEIDPEETIIKKTEVIKMVDDTVSDDNPEAKYVKKRDTDVTESIADFMGGLVREGSFTPEEAQRVMDRVIEKMVEIEIKNEWPDINEWEELIKDKRQVPEILDLVAEMIEDESWINIIKNTSSKEDLSQLLESIPLYLWAKGKDRSSLTKVTNYAMRTGIKADQNFLDNFKSTPVGDAVKAKLIEFDLIELREKRGPFLELLEKVTTLDELIELLSQEMYEIGETQAKKELGIKDPMKYIAALRDVKAGYPFLAEEYYDEDPIKLKILEIIGPQTTEIEADGEETDKKTEKKNWFSRLFKR